MTASLAGRVIGIILVTAGCTRSPYERGGFSQGLGQHDVERDYYMEREYKARLANDQHLYNQSTPYPLGPGPQDPTGHARALHGISTINTMRDTCLAAKGYRVESHGSASAFSRFPPRMFV